MPTPLCCESNVSFFEGASHLEELAVDADPLGLGEIARTNHVCANGDVPVNQWAKKRALALIIGTEATVEKGTTNALLVQGREGFANRCRFLGAPNDGQALGNPFAVWPCDHAGMINDGLSATFFDAYQAHLDLVVKAP